jgi:hypothetical protein
MEWPIVGIIEKKSLVELSLPLNFQRAFSMLIEKVK